MILTIMSWLSDIARWFTTRQREREQQRLVDEQQTGRRRLARTRTRELVVDSIAVRLGEVAEREGIDVEELSEAVRLIALDFPMTMSEVLEQVERHGLADARAKIAAAVMGGAS